MARKPEPLQIRTKHAFYTVPTRIWRVTDGEKPLGLVAKAVYVYLWSHASPDAQAFPSVATIAKGISASRRAVQYAIRELEGLNLLEASDRYAEGGRQTSNLYVLNTPEDAALVRGAPGARGESAPGASGGRKECTDGGATGAPEPDPEEPDPMNNNSNSDPKLQEGLTLPTLGSHTDDVVVVLNAYKKATGLSDLVAKIVTSWLSEHGKEYVLSKIDMLRRLIACGRRIKRPLAWLATAIREDWTPSVDLDEQHQARRAEATQRIIEEAKAAELCLQDPSFRSSVAANLASLKASLL